MGEERRMGNGKVGRLSESAYNALVSSRGTKEPRIHQNSVPSRALASTTVKNVSVKEGKIYRSKLELAFALRLEVMKREGEIDGWLYEPFTFKLAEGKRYRVDFISWVWMETDGVDGAPVGRYVTTAYECKGWHKNYRDSMTHLKWAAQRFPFFEWKKVVRNGKTGFEIYDVRV